MKVTAKSIGTAVSYLGVTGLLAYAGYALTGGWAGALAVPAAVFGVMAALLAPVAVAVVVGSAAIQIAKLWRGENA